MGYAEWSKAPDWANWHAIDGDGEGFWYETKPVCSVFRNIGITWHFKDGLIARELFSGYYDVPDDITPEESLEERPAGLSHD